MSKGKKNGSHTGFVARGSATHPVNNSDSVVAPVTPTQVEVLRAFISEYKIRESESTRLQMKTLKVGVVTALLVFAYTTVAAFQWYEMKKATCASQEAAKAARQSAKTSTDALYSSYRPWVGVPGEPEVIGPIHQNPSKINFKFELRNSGTSVALGVQTALWIGGDFSTLPRDSCKKMADTEKRAIYLAHTTGGKAGGVTPETGEVIFPNGADHDQLRPQAGAPTGPTENVYALLCIAYFDQFENVHLTKLTYCMTPWLNPAWKNLPLFCGDNYAD